MKSKRSYSEMSFSNIMKFLVPNKFSQEVAFIHSTNRMHGMKVRETTGRAERKNAK